MTRKKLLLASLVGIVVFFLSAFDFNADRRVYAPKCATVVSPDGSEDDIGFFAVSQASTIIRTGCRAESGSPAVRLETENADLIDDPTCGALGTTMVWDETPQFASLPTNSVIRYEITATGSAGWIMICFQHRDS